MTENSGNVPDVNDVPGPSPEVVRLIREVFDLWQQGQQQLASERLSQQAQSDPNSVWPRAWLLWMYMNQGSESGFRSGLPVADSLVQDGAGWAAWQFVNNMLTNAHAWPVLVDDAMRLLQTIATDWPHSAPGPDIISPAWNLLANGQDQVAAKVFQSAESLRAPTALSHLVQEANVRLELIRQAVATSEGQAHRISELAKSEAEAITRTREELSTKAKQAEILIDSVSSGTVNERFESAALSNANESKLSYRWGLGVLASAAAVTALPLILHYLGGGPEYSQVQLLGAHASATLALGALAGVLLARARGRDRARQRASDLSTAMGTIIVYSGQIHDPVEKQRFMQTMGQMVLVAHLQVDQKGGEEATIGLASLLSALRTPPNSP